MTTLNKIAVCTLGSLALFAVTFSAVVASIWAILHSAFLTAGIFSGLAVMSGVARKIVNDHLDAALKIREAERLKSGS
jgi:hypothetical protein